MSLEKALELNTEALNRNTAAMEVLIGTKKKAARDEAKANPTPESDTEIDDEADEVEEEVKPKKKPKAKAKPKKKAKGLSRDDMRKKLMAASKEHGKPAVVEVLQSFGADTLNDLDESDYEALASELEEMI